MRRARIPTAFTALVFGVSMLIPTSASAHRNRPGPTPGITVLTTAVVQPYGSKFVTARCWSAIASAVLFFVA